MAVREHVYLLALEHEAQKLIADTGLRNEVAADAIKALFRI